MSTFVSNTLKNVATGKKTVTQIYKQLGYVYPFYPFFFFSKNGKAILKEGEMPLFTEII